MKRIVTLIAIILFMSTSLCSAQENLNEIRFKGWTEKEWLDNDHIRELRKNDAIYLAVSKTLFIFA